MFLGVYWNQPVCTSVRMSICVSVCIQNTGFCQSAGGDIKSYLVTALVINLLSNYSNLKTSIYETKLVYR